MNSTNYNNEWPGKICPLVNSYVIRVTSLFLFGFKAYSTRLNSCLALLTG